MDIAFRDEPLSWSRLEAREKAYPNAAVVAARCEEPRAAAKEHRVDALQQQYEDNGERIRMKNGSQARDVARTRSLMDFAGAKNRESSSPDDATSRQIPPSTLQLARILPIACNRPPRCQSNTAQWDSCN